MKEWGKNFDPLKKPNAFESETARVAQYLYKGKSIGWIFTRKDTNLKFVEPGWGENGFKLESDNSRAIVMHKSGIIEEYGSDLFLHDVEEQKSLYKEGVGLLQAHGIEISRTNAKYSDIEKLIKQNLLESKSAVNPDNLKKGDLIIIPGLECGDFGWRSREIVCAGEINNVKKSEIYKGSHWTVEFRNPDCWFIVYEKYLPGEDKNIHHISPNGSSAYSGGVYGISKYDSLDRYDLNIGNIFSGSRERKKLEDAPFHRLNHKLLVALRNLKND